MRLSLVPVLAALCLPLAPAASLAATMTFAFTDYTALEDSYAEDGIQATADGIFGSGADDVQHLDDFGTDAPSTVRFRMAGLFDALSFDLLPLAFTLSICNGNTDTCIMPTYENVLVQGFRKGVAVAAMSVDMSLLGAGTVLLGNAFRNLDALEIGVVMPPDALWADLDDPFYGDCDAPCSHFEIDNVTLAQAPPLVPLPGAALLLASAVAGLAALRRTARRA